MKTAALFCLLASSLLTSAAIGADGERDERLRNEAIQNQETGVRRQHWLYDEENRPQTTGAAPQQPCRDARVRVPRGDGTTAVARIDKCS